MLKIPQSKLIYLELPKIHCGIYLRCMTNSRAKLRILDLLYKLELSWIPWEYRDQKKLMGYFLGWGTSYTNCIALPSSSRINVEKKITQKLSFFVIFVVPIIL